MRRACLLVSLAAGLLLGACGGGDDDDGGSGGSKAEGTAAEGSLYEVKLPDGWRDRTDAASDEDVPIKFDRVFATGFAEGFRTNVNVIRERRPGQLTLDEVARVSGRQLRSAYGATDLGKPRKLRLGEEDARAYAYSVATQGKKLRGEQVIAFRGERIFYVTFTALRSVYGDRHGEFEQILGSWSWK